LLASLVLVAVTPVKVTVAEIIVPDWTSPNWGQEYLEMDLATDGKGPFGTSLGSIKLAGQQGFMSGIREYCGEHADVYLLAVGQVLRQVWGNTENSEQMPWLVAVYAFHRIGVKEKMVESDCQSEAAIRWMSIQDSSLENWKSVGLQLPTEEEMEEYRKANPEPIGPGKAIPRCPTSDVFHNCRGSKTLANGKQFFGSWKNNKPWTGLSIDQYSNFAVYRKGIRSKEAEGIVDESHGVPTSNTQLKAVQP